MELRRTAAIGLVMLGTSLLAAPAFAQGTASDRTSGNVDVNRLPLNVQRIQRELQQASTTTEERHGLNLRYQIEVFGRAPEIKLFTADDNLTTGPVPYGAPTHREVVEQITPREFRAPVMDFNALAKWLAGKSRK
jgi:hypothetical protein